jgi:flagellar motor switch protein FliG
MKMNVPEKSAIFLMNLGEEKSAEVLANMDEEKSRPLEIIC